MYPTAIAERDIEICALIAQGMPASTIAERFGLPELDVMAIAVIGPEIPRHDLWLRAERERQSESAEKARMARGVARSVGPYLQTPTHYPPFGIHKPGKLEELEKALQIQLKAVGAKAGKGEDEIRRARAQIFTVLNEKGGRVGLWMPRVDQEKRDVASEFCGEYTPLAYVAEGIVRSGSLYTLTAKTGAALGTAFNVIIKVAVQRGFGHIPGHEVTHGHIAYLACENPEDVRVKFMAAAHPWRILLGEIAGRIVILDYCKKPEEVCEDLTRLSAAELFGLVVLDAQAAFYNAPDVNDTADWATGAAHQKEIRKWRAALGPSRDWVAILVRKARLQSRAPGWKRHSEALAIQRSVNVAYADLSVIEKRAVDMIIGKRRRLRVTRNDPATKLAKAVRGEWLRSVPPFREKEAARTLTTETIVRAVLPILDALANGPIRGGTPDNDYDPAKMEPAALGALVAIARMSHPHAGFEHICDVIQKSRRMAREAIT